MRRSSSTAVLAAILVALAATQAASRQACKPTLSSKASRSSAVLNQQRRWTTVFAVDASRCSTTSGTFDIQFVREKEVGPDLAFTQRFIWSAGRTEVALDLWWDEWVRTYQLGDVTSCPCRDETAANDAISGR